MLHSLLRRLPILALLLACGTALAQAPGWADRVDAYLEDELAGRDLPGVVVAVTDADGLLYARSFGTLRPGGEEAVTPGTPFEIGSLAKSMTSLAILQLVAAGEVELDAPVRRYLPWWTTADEAASERVTVRQLLAHASGLPTSSHGVVWQDFERIDGSAEEAVRALATVEPATAPGEAFAYANMGYATLGVVVEAVSGLSWSEYVGARILAPLGMTRSSARLEDRDALGAAPPHTLRAGRLVEVGPMSPFMAPAGSTVVASAEDMARYLRAWLDPAAHAAMPAGAEAAFGPVIASGGGERYGLGWGMQDRRGSRLVYHTGGTIGSSSFMSVLPEEGLGVIVLANAMTAVPVGLGMGVNDLLLGAAPTATGVDVLRLLSLVLGVLGLLGLVLLAWLAARIVRIVRRGPRRRRGGVLLARGAALVVGTVAFGIALRPTLAVVGLPYPYGLRGYPFDWAFGLGTLLVALVAWSLYGVATLLLARRPRVATRPRAPRGARAA